MSELQPHTVDAAQWREIAAAISSSVNGAQCLPFEWQDDRGTQVEVVIDGDQAHFSRREANAREMTSVSYNMQSGSVNATGLAVDEASARFNMSRYDAATVLVLGDLATRPADPETIIPSLAVLPDSAGNSEAADFEPLPTAKVWDSIMQIERMAYEYDPDGPPQDRRNNHSWVSYESNGQTFVDTLSYYETEEGRYFPRVVTQRIDPDTLAALQTDVFLLTDDELAAHIIEPDDLNAASSQKTAEESYAILSTLIENMHNELNAQRNFR